MYKFNYAGQHFLLESEETLIPDFPLTVTLQINRACNLKCVYCSEYQYFDEMSIEDVRKAVNNLYGINRIIISGGEPLLHKNLIDILKLCREKFDVVALATNAVLLTLNDAIEIVKYIDYFDVTIDGTRKIHNEIRGEFDGIIDGIRNISNANGEFSVVSVLFNKNKDSIIQVATIADTLGAKKLKILCPIPKGKGINIVGERLSQEQNQEIYNSLVEAKNTFGYNLKILMTDWDKIKEGHAILIHPDGKVVASPVWTKENCIDIIGNIYANSIKEIWEDYPYKINHVNKYIEKTMMVC